MVSKAFKHSTFKSDYPQRAEYAKDEKFLCIYTERFSKFIFFKTRKRLDFQFPVPHVSHFALASKKLKRLKKSTTFLRPIARGRHKVNQCPKE